MEIPKGFQQTVINSGGIVFIKDQDENEYLLVPSDGVHAEFWISAHEISKHISKRTHMIYAASLPKENPWIFIDVDMARQLAHKQGGRLPTEQEYQRFCELAEKYQLEEKCYVWTETKNSKKHYIARKGKEREECYATREASFISFRIVIDV